MNYLWTWVTKSETEEFLNKRISLKREIERLVFNPYTGKRMKRAFLKLAEEAGVNRDFHIKDGSILIKNSRFFSKIRGNLYLECVVGGNHPYIILFISRDGMKTIVTRIGKNDRETISAYTNLMAKIKKNIGEKTKKWETIYMKLSLMATPYLVGQEV